MTAPRAGIVASARGRCTVCGPHYPGWVRIVTARFMPHGARFWPCWHCSPAPGDRPMTVLIYDFRDDVPSGGSAA